MPTNIPAIDDLEALESFDPTAFIADDRVSQDLYNFVLALALIFNDFKDLLHFNELLNTLKPEGEFKITKKHGACSGLTHHYMRLLLGLVHEFINLIRVSEKEIEHPFFVSVIQSLPHEQRNAWMTIVESSQGKPIESQIGKFLLHVRNQVIYHYEPKSIYLGYKHFFDSKVKGSERAYISRGDSMIKTRFYFADAAVLGCFTRDKEGYKGEDIFVDSIKLLGNLNFTLMNIVTLFINKRKFAFRPVEEET